MKITLKIEQEFEAKYLHAKVGVRYWEDSEINNESDSDGKLTPCREGYLWCPIIELETGKITNWEQGKKADIHFKSCDNNEFLLLDENKNTIKSIDGYVIKCMSPKENGYGDYVIMDIDENGFIKNWKPTLDEFTEDDE